MNCFGNKSKTGSVNMVFADPPYGIENRIKEAQNAPTI